MAKSKKARRDAELDEKELRRQKGEPLPERAVMSTISPSIAPEPVVPLDDSLMPIDPIPGKP